MDLQHTVSQGLGPQISQADLLLHPNSIHPGTPAGAFLHHKGTTNQTPVNQLLSSGTEVNFGGFKDQLGPSESRLSFPAQGLSPLLWCPIFSCVTWQDYRLQLLLFPSSPSSKVSKKKEIQLNTSGELHSRGEANLLRITSWWKWI